jgi:hypothetical protein
MLAPSGGIEGWKRKVGGFAKADIERTTLLIHFFSNQINHSSRILDIQKQFLLLTKSQ